MTTKDVGNRAEGAVAAALMKHGYAVLLPLGDNKRYDLVIDDDGVLKRIQCKAGRLNKNHSVLSFNACSSHYHREHAYRDYCGQIDLFAVYCAERDEVYLIPIGDIGSIRKPHLRLCSSKNNQNSGLRWAQDYLLT